MSPSTPNSPSVLPTVVKLHLAPTTSRKKDSESVGNRAKSRISKRLKRAFQENKAREIFRKTKISYSLIRTCACAY